MNELTKEKSMTVKEISEVLLISESSIKRAIKKYFPEKMINGKKTHLNEIEVTIIKKELESHHNHKYNYLNKQGVSDIVRFIGGLK